MNECGVADASNKRKKEVEVKGKNGMGRRK
jgi:hypothetical protein